MLRKIGEAAHLAIRGRNRSGKSMVLAMPMTARREPLRVGHSMRLYNTCIKETLLFGHALQSLVIALKQFAQSRNSRTQRSEFLSNTCMST